MIAGIERGNIVSQVVFVTICILIQKIKKLIGQRKAATLLIQKILSLFIQSMEKD